MRVKLKKGRSFTTNINGKIVIVTRDRPEINTPDEETAKNLVATGYFEYVEDTAETEEADSDNDEDIVTGDKTPPAYGGKTLDEMNTSEIETFAAYKGVNLKGIRKRDAMVAKLREELPAEELEGVIEYGSPTMQELQK